MSASARTISQFLTSDVTHELRDVGVTALRFWRRTMVWIFAIAIVCAAVVFATGSEPDMHGFFIGLLITVALFPPAVFAGLETGSKWDGSRVGVLLLSASLVSFVLVVANGYWLPSLNTGGAEARQHYSLDSMDRFAYYGLRNFTQPELLQLRDELQDRREAVRQEYRALDVVRRPTRSTGQEMLLLEMRSGYYRDEISWMSWLHQLRTALGLLPLVSVALGLMIGRWSTLVAPGMKRQFFTWSASLPLFLGTGFALATATVYSRPVPRFDGLASSAFTHVLVFPIVLLIALFGLWQVVRPRVQENSG